MNYIELRDALTAKLEAALAAADEASELARLVANHPESYVRADDGSKDEYLTTERNAKQEVLIYRVQAEAREALRYSKYQDVSEFKLRRNVRNWIEKNADQHATAEDVTSAACEAFGIPIDLTDEGEKFYWIYRSAREANPNVQAEHPNANSLDD